jgi:hypothetical protein
MDITITINTDNDAFQHGGLYVELRRILSTCVEKIKEQRSRSLTCKCDAPEAADVLIDINGNTVGEIMVTRS